MIKCLTAVVYPVALLCLSNSISLAQSGQTIADTDTASFETVMEQSFRELTETDYDAEVQRTYADIFAEYYMTHPDEKYSEWALVHAFKFWSNIGAVEETEKAMERLDYDSEIWSEFIVFLSNTYYRNRQKTIEDYLDLLNELKTRLTHPRSRSAVLFALTQQYKEDDDTEEVKELARRLVELNADAFYVDQALGILYELESLNIGDPAPLFQAKTLRGDSISLADHLGKMVILEFWATWCGPCLPEIPHLKSIRSAYPENDLQIIGISLDSDAEKLKAFLQENALPWPQIQQPEEWKDELPTLYNVSGIPRTYIIGRSGNIVAKDVRGEELEKAMAQLMCR